MALWVVCIAEGLFTVAQLFLSVGLDHILLDVGQNGRVRLVFHGEFTCSSVTNK